MFLRWIFLSQKNSERRVIFRESSWRRKKSSKKQMLWEKHELHEKWLITKYQLGLYKHLIIKDKQRLFLYLTSDFRQARKTFDTSETKKEFGPVVIEYGKVQSKVSLKYDSLHKEVLGKFGSMLGNEMASFHNSVSKVGTGSSLALPHPFFFIFSLLFILPSALPQFLFLIYPMFFPSPHIVFLPLSLPLSLPSFDNLLSSSPSSSLSLPHSLPGPHFFPSTSSSFSSHSCSFPSSLPQPLPAPLRHPPWPSHSLPPPSSSLYLFPFFLFFLPLPPAVYFT